MKPLPISPDDEVPAETSDVDSSAKHWLIVTQYKSDRVVYFTDDPEFDIPANADWCYVSPHAGDLPEGMTLRNCWGWRYRGFSFIDARQAPPRNRAEALLDHNKEALRKLLREKIDALRKPVAPTNSMGAQLRATKLEEARSVLAGGTDLSTLRLLPTAAAVRDISLVEMAESIVIRDRQTRALLERTEIVREEIVVAIERATTQDTLTRLRTRLMGELAPETTAEDVIKPEHTTPQKMAGAPTADELERERLRLRIKLRMKINDLRRPYVSDYLLDDEVLRNKSRIAEAVVGSGGAVPHGVDGTPLISHAAGRGQSLFAAAQDVLSEVNEVDAVLLETEKIKDAFLSHLAAIKTFSDIKDVSRLIDKVDLRMASFPDKHPP